MVLFLLYTFIFFNIVVLDVGSYGFGIVDTSTDSVLLEMLTDIQKRLDDKDNEIIELNNKINDMKVSMETSKIQCERDINLLNDQVSSQTRLIKKLTTKSWHAPENNKMTSVHWKRRSVDEHLNRRQLFGDSPVAFFATLSDNILHNGINQHILFDNVVTNTGHAYVTPLGAFVCPTPGLYVFSVTLVSHLGHNTHFEINKNGIAISRLYVRSSESVVDTSAQTVIFQLDKGDVVTIRNTDADEALLGGNYTVFSGFLLQ